MSRYLTPSRLCLLLLIELYLSGETATSAQLELLRYISQSVGSPSNEYQNNASALSWTSIQEFAVRLSKWPSRVPGRTVYDMFLQRIWDVDSLDALFVVFERLINIIQPVGAATPEAIARKLSRASPLGQFIRKCKVEFTRLPFAGAQSLWYAFKTYREPTFQAWAKRNTEAARDVDDDFGSPSHLHHDPGDALISGEDTDGIIVFSIQQLQKLGTRVPPEIKAKVHNWMSAQSDANAPSLVHFLIFFDNWRAGQYSLALESLHRYFDYSLNLNPASDNMRMYYQYALLHLSILHADFECWEESVDAMDECIATARENQDTECLNFALSWLMYLRQASATAQKASFGRLGSLFSSRGGQRDEIAFLKSKARDKKHWALLSSTLLEEAKLEMYTAGSSPKAMEHVVQSAYLNIQHDLRTMVPATTLFQGAYMERMGQPHLSMNACESITFLYHDSCPIHDLTRATSRLAQSLAESGLYDQAIKTLEQVKPSVDTLVKQQHRVTGFTAFILLKRALRRGDLHVAEHYVGQLQIFRPFADPDLALEIDLIEIDWLMQKKELDRAWQSIHKHIQSYRDVVDFDMAQRLQLLVVKCQLFVESGHSTKAFSLTLRVASTAMRLLIVPVLTQALELLGTILNDLSEFEAARDLVEALLPMALEGANSRVVAKLFATLTDSHVGIAGFVCEKDGPEQMKHMRIAETYAERARATYAQIQDASGMLDMLAAKQRLALWHGDEAVAEQAEELYSQILADQAKRQSEA